MKQYFIKNDLENEFFFIKFSQHCKSYAILRKLHIMGFTNSFIHEGFSEYDNVLGYGRHLMLFDLKKVFPGEFIIFRNKVFHSILKEEELLNQFIVLKDNLLAPRDKEMFQGHLFEGDLAFLEQLPYNSQIIINPHDWDDFDEEAIKIQILVNKKLKTIQKGDLILFSKDDILIEDPKNYLSLPYER